MESLWTYGLIAMALVAMAFSYRISRAWWWIACGGVSFFVSTLFLDVTGRADLHPWLTFACDALVLMIVLHWSRETWELGVAVAFLASVAASLIQIWATAYGAPLKPGAYASMLELANVGALLCITGTGVVGMVGRREGSVLGDLRALLHSSRSSV